MYIFYHFPTHLPPQNIRTEFDGYERLFSRFLCESGQSVRWEDISTLPPSAVSPL